MAFALTLPSLPKRYQPAAIWALYIVGLAPGVWYFYLAATGGLGFNPVKDFEHLLGIWALRFLCLGLMVTPMRDLFNINLIAYRRALGLIAFYYVLAHFTVYLVLDRGLVLSSIAGDILKRPYIMLGMAGLLMLVPLALTSNRWSIRTLGSRWNTPAQTRLSDPAGGRSALRAGAKVNDAGTGLLHQHHDHPAGLPAGAADAHGTQEGR